MFKAKLEIWFRRRQKTVSILFRQVKKRQERGQAEGARTASATARRTCYPSGALAPRAEQQNSQWGLCGIAL
jgi:hypothetical protein